MNRQLAALSVLAVSTFLCTSAFAHHSQAPYDLSQEVLIKGKLARLDWKNPHMYFIVDTTGADGKSQMVQVEGLSIQQAQVDGLHREDLQVGMPVVVRANPNREPGKTVRGLDVTTQDGVVHPIYAENKRKPTLTPATSLAGNWAPSLATTNAMFREFAQWQYTEAGHAAQAKGRPADGICYVEPIPFQAILNEVRAIDVSEKEIVFRFDNSGDIGVRVVHMGATHPANVKPSRFGHAIGKWEGDTLVIDTVGYAPDPSGLSVNVPSSPSKHTVERVKLTDDRLHLSYEATVEDPYLVKPVTFSILWDHRPDLKLSGPEEACDKKVAHRFLED
jgi:hypothetical protein